MNRLSTITAAAAILLGMTLAAKAADVDDVTDPGDHIAGAVDKGGHWDGPPANAIDNDPATKYYNTQGPGTGFRVTIDPQAELSGIAITTADADWRDPQSVTIRASNDGKEWVPIVTDLATPVPSKRNQETVYTFKPQTPGAFKQYDVVFPTTRGGKQLAVAEVRLIGKTQ